VLQELAIELDDEREFTDKWARDCPKNYQAMLEKNLLKSRESGQIRATENTTWALKR